MPGPDYRVDFNGVQSIASQDLTCGYCSREVSSNQGWPGQGRYLGASGESLQVDGDSTHYIVLCPRCGAPTYVHDETQVPGVAFGEIVEYLPKDVARLYREARDSIGAGNFNAAVMVGRKLLMSVAVTKGAAAGGSFKSYVQHLEGQGVVTADMNDWIDEIRELGNDANHELPDMTADEAEALITFVAMLLKLAYEYPERGRRSVAARVAKAQLSSTP